MADHTPAPGVNADMRAFWNQEGGEKWVHHHRAVEAGLMPFGLAAMEAAGIAPGERVLDIGCGCGDTTFEIARRVGPGGHVHGVDISAVILAQAQARAEAEGVENVTFVEADAQLNPFDQAAFDVVFSRFGVMFFDDPAAAFANICTALKPGGRLGFASWQPARQNAWARVPLEVVARHVPVPPPADPHAPGPFAFADAARVAGILTAAGFAQVHAETLATPYVFGATTEETVAFIMNMVPTSRILTDANASQEQRAAIAADMVQTLTPHTTARGVEMDGAIWVVTARNP